MAQPSNFQAAIPAMEAQAALTNDYKSLIGIFLAGGCCAHNTIYPRTGSNRTHYEALRPGIALPDNPDTALDDNWCLHPALTGLKSIWDAGNLAIVRNVGPLVNLTTKSTYLNKQVQLPPQIYSHADQQDLWETGISNEPQAITGWMGRMSELLTPYNAQALSSPMLSFSGAVDTMRGYDIRSLGLDSNGMPVRDYGFRMITQVANIIENMFQTATHEHPMVREYLAGHKRSVAVTSDINAAIAGIADPENIPTTISLGRQMRTAIRMSSNLEALNLRRGMFFMRHWSYDHHADQLALQQLRFSELDPVIKAGYDAAVANNLNTTFVVFSEFGRSLRQNGSGTDHGWGGHALVFGPGVKGGWYGIPHNLDPDGPDIVLSQGHMIPTTSVESLVATLGRWMGIPDATSNGVNPIELLSPRLMWFPTRNLNFYL